MDGRATTGLQDRVAGWVASAFLGTLPLTPALFLLKLLRPDALTWAMVLVPWFAGLHLPASWMMGRLLAQILWILLRQGE